VHRRPADDERAPARRLRSPPPRGRPGSPSRTWTCTWRASRWRAVGRNKAARNPSGLGRTRPTQLQSWLSRKRRSRQRCRPNFETNHAVLHLAMLRNDMHVPQHSPHTTLAAVQRFPLAHQPGGELRLPTPVACPTRRCRVMLRALMELHTGPSCRRRTRQARVAAKPARPHPAQAFP